MLREASHEPVPSLESIVARFAPSVVKVRASRRGTGSGVIWRAGRIVTNAHVATHGPTEVELAGGEVLAGELIRRDPGADLACLRVEGAGSPSVVIGDSDRVRPGQIVVSLGNPLGLGRSVALGVIHAVPPRHQSTRMIVADIRLAPGYSGGPMLDSRGRIIGVNTMVSGGLGLAVPANRVTAFLESLDRRSLGIMVTSITNGAESGRTETLLIAGVSPDSPAAKANILPGDIIASVDQHAIRGLHELSLSLDRAGAQVVLGLLRGGKSHTVEVGRARRSDVESGRAA